MAELNAFQHQMIASRRLEMAVGAADEEFIRTCLEEWPSAALGSPLSAFVGKPKETRQLLEYGCRLKTGDVDLFFNWFHLSLPLSLGRLLADGMTVWELWFPQVKEDPRLRECCLRRWTRDAENVRSTWKHLRLEELLLAHQESPLWEVPSRELLALENGPKGVLKLNAMQLAWTHGNFEACQMLLESKHELAWSSVGNSCWPTWDLEQALTLGVDWLKGLPEKKRRVASKILAHLKEEEVLSLDSYQSLMSWLLAQHLERTWELPASSHSCLRL